MRCSDVEFDANGDPATLIGCREEGLGVSIPARIGLTRRDSPDGRMWVGGLSGWKWQNTGEAYCCPGIWLWDPDDTTAASAPPRATRSGSERQYDTFEQRPEPSSAPAIQAEAARLLEEVLSTSGGGGSLNDTLRARARNAEPQGGANGADQPSVMGNLGALAMAARGTNSGATAPSDAPTSPAPEAPSVRGNVRFDGGDEIGGSGDFDSKLVMAEVRKRLAAIKACYEQQLRRNPALQGKVTLEFTIEQSGTVSKTAASGNTTNDPGVAACVVGEVKRFQFSPGPQGGSVTYSCPFMFTPQ